VVFFVISYLHYIIEFIAWKFGSVLLHPVLVGIPSFISRNGREVRRGFRDFDASNHPVVLNECYPNASTNDLILIAHGILEDIRRSGRPEPDHFQISFTRYHKRWR
jgi:hypothetical protein